MKKNKASGEKVIASEMLKAGGNSPEETIWGLIKQIWKKEQIPKKWN